MLLMEKVLQAAKPYLQGHKVTDLVIGLTMLSVQLDNGNLGIAYILRQNMHAGCGAFRFTENVIGSDAETIAAFCLDPEPNYIKRAVGIATLNAAAASQDLPGDRDDSMFGIELRPTDKVGMVGLIRPIAMQVMKTTPNLYIFDMDLEPEPGLPLQDMAKQDEILAGCDVVMLSGTTTINGTVEHLVPLCSKARDIVIIGQSTPMYNDGVWDGTKVSRLAGCIGKPECKEQLFKEIALGGGTARLLPYMTKKCMVVK